MNELSVLQKNFQNYILDTSANGIVHAIANQALMAEKRLSIYSDGYRLRLLEALVFNYSILQAYLGEERFTALGNAYIKAHPSYYRSIRWFGDKLSHFLSEHPLYKSYPYLAELATVEWTLTKTFDGLDSVILRVEDIASIPPEAWETMHLQAQPTVYRINLSWNVTQIWQAITQEEEPPEPVKTKDAIPYIFWRKELTNHFCSLSIEEAWAFDAMQENASFSEICEGLCQWISPEEAPTYAASLLKNWIVADLLSAVTLVVAGHLGGD